MTPTIDEDEEGIFLPTDTPLKEQIAAIRKNESTYELFQELARPKSPLVGLLLRHPDDLFPKLDPENESIPEDYSISLHMLYRENFEEITKDVIKRPSLSDYIRNNKLLEESESLVESEESIEELSASEDFEFQELVLLNGLRLIQYNHHLLALAQQKEEITLPDIRKALGQKGINYKPIEEEALQLMEKLADDQGLGAIFKIVLRRSLDDSETAYELKKMAKEMYSYVKELLIDLPALAGEVHRFFPSAFNEYGAPFFRKHNAFTNWSYGYTNHNYKKALNFLWKLDLLRPVVVNLICLKCSDSEGKPIHQTLNSDMSPEDLDGNVYCSWCKKPMFVQAFYNLDSWLNRWILTKDKLLSYMVAYLLDENGLDWEPHVYSDQSEHDFHIKTSKGLHIIECKVFRVSGPIKEDNKLQEKIRNGINQLVQHMIEVKADSAYLVCNPCIIRKNDLDKWIRSAIKMTKRSLKKDAIQVIGPEKLAKTIKQLV